MDVLLMLALVLVSSSYGNSMAAAASDVPRNQLQVAIEEMQRANYFTFVMLINMAPPDLIPVENVTFLMPNDKSLSKNIMETPANENSITDFLLRHSIPFPLLFEHLQHFPTDSMIPTSKPNLVLRITNQGSRRRFFLNNVRITGPNICSRGSSIRCHGIDGVIQDLVLTNGPPADHECQQNNSSSTRRSSPPPTALSSPPPKESSSTAAPPPGPGGEDINKSSASSLHQMWCCYGVCEFFTMCLVLLISAQVVRTC
ncbi:hypothetical protein ACH5RR_017367 [Cinchona calisaya]|uniref:FAS1 domain-containing protein n=1 Tax=Cinchona calisaya TaxID=153742 RepID=A0ABD2ZYZ4_9GENT